MQGYFALFVVTCSVEFCSVSWGAGNRVHHLPWDLEVHNSIVQHTEPSAVLTLHCPVKPQLTRDQTACLYRVTTVEYINIGAQVVNMSLLYNLIY